MVSTPTSPCSVPDAVGLNVRVDTSIGARFENEGTPFSVIGTAGSKIVIKFDHGEIRHVSKAQLYSYVSNSMTAKPTGWVVGVSRIKHDGSTKDRQMVRTTKRLWQLVVRRFSSTSVSYSDFEYWVWCGIGSQWKHTEGIQLQVLVPTPDLDLDALALVTKQQKADFSGDSGVGFTGRKRWVSKLNGKFLGEFQDQAEAEAKLSAAVDIWISTQQYLHPNLKAYYLALTQGNTK